MKAIWKNEVIAEAPVSDLIRIEGNWYFPPKSINWEFFEESKAGRRVVVQLKTSILYKRFIHYINHQTRRSLGCVATKAMKAMRWLMNGLIRRVRA